jgi:predicted SprT family Zn-dependent metalloprotease
MSKSGTTDSLSLCSPAESIEIMSPSSPPPLRAPSVPATPRHEATGYASDESDVIVPRRRLVGRRIIVSDDEDAPPRPRGLRGRVPAAIARLNALNSDDDEEPEFLMDSSMDSAGSLREFVLSDSEVEEDVADGGEDEEEEASSSDVDSDEPAAGDTLPIPVINLVSDSEDDRPSPRSPAVLTFSPPPPPAPMPDIGSLSLSSPAKLAPPPRPKPRKQMSPREWEAHRVKYAQALFDELDANVFDARLGRRGAGCTIKWDSRINKSAGMAHRRATRHKDGSSTHELWIALAPKVLSEERQIRDTLAHEMCHVAAWAISGEFKNPHGKVFKTWGRKVMRARPDISVTTKHDYVINYKYEWQCTNVGCRKIYRRHSKSIDTTRQVCGACRARLAPLFATKELSPYQQYVKAYMKTAQAAMPGATFGQISRALSDRWTAAKSASAPEHDAYWRDFVYAP